MISADLLKEVIGISVEAGKAILDIYNGNDPGITIKADSSPLTRADRASHDVIVRRMESISSFPLMSEEGSAIPYEERKGWDTFWLIDPLDGTKEFIKKNGEFTVNIALIHEGAPVMGSVYCPVLRRLYFGYEASGSFMLDDLGFDNIPEYNSLLKKAQKLPLVNPREIFTVVASRSHANAETEKYLEKLRKEHGQLRIVSKGSSLKLCMVAEGVADLYPRLGPTMEWDTAAAHAVVRYAGGTVNSFDSGMSLLYNKENLVNPYFIVSME